MDVVAKPGLVAANTWLRGWPRLAVRSAHAGLALIVVLVAARRLAGALTQPLDDVALLACGLIAPLLAAAERWLAAHDEVPPTTPRELFAIPAMRVAAIVVFGWAISLAGSSTLGLLAYWGAAVGGEAACGPWSQWRSSRRPRVRLLAPGEDTDEFAPDGDSPPDDEIAVAVVEGDVRQVLTRLTAADGTDVLRGEIIAEFAPGQARAAVHIAFCPAFAATPAIEFEQVAGPDARIQIGQALPWGARFDVKLPQPATGEMRVRLALEARSLATTT